MKISQIIKEKLESVLKPIKLDIIDESFKHHGHLGYSHGNETHFKLLIVSSQFNNLNRIKRQRLIYDILKDELKNNIHALSLTTLTPNEFLLKPSNN